MPAPNQMLVFDRGLVRAHRDRAAARFSMHKALFDEIATSLIERLDGIRQEFGAVLDLGAHTGDLARHFALRGTPLVVATDISEKMLRQSNEDVAFHAVAADEESLPFTPESFDLVLSNLALHWVNDLPGTLAQIENILRPRGMFLAALIGGETLTELRACLMDAEMAVTGGASLRLSPTIELRTASALLQRAGFGLPVVDREFITLEYADIFALMRDLRGMGESGSHLSRIRRLTRHRLFAEAGRLYRERFGTIGGAIPARFEIVFLHGVKHEIRARARL